MNYLGTIRFINNYTDGEERWEIPVKNPDGFPYLKNKPNLSEIVIGNENYLCTIRFTENSGCWICAYLFANNDLKTKIRLSYILKKNGYKRNQRAVLKVNKSLNQLLLQKA